VNKDVTNTEPRASDLKRAPVTRYAIQHKTSLRYLAAHPDLGVHLDDADEANAVVWPYMTIAELYRIAMDDCAEWSVVQVRRIPA
jgi:hypothetical protein